MPGENMFLRDFARLWDPDQSGFRSRFGDLETSLSVNWSIHTIYIKLNLHQAVLNNTNAACWETCLSANPYHGARLNACCGFSGVHGRRVVKKPDSKQSLGFRLKAKKCLDLKQLKTQIFANF